jgi:hypothetical protein
VLLALRSIPLTEVCSDPLGGDRSACGGALADKLVAAFGTVRLRDLSAQATHRAISHLVWSEDDSLDRATGPEGRERHSTGIVDLFTTILLREWQRHRRRQEEAAMGTLHVGQGGVYSPMRIGVKASFSCVVATFTALALLAGPQVVSASQSPPGAHTAGYTGLTTSGATIQGSVSPSNQETSYYFQYGPTSAYGSQTSLTVAGGGTVTINVQAAIGGLSPATTYHYRLVASNAAGTSTGADRLLTTSKIPFTFKVSTTPSLDVFGGPVFLSGTLAGTGSASHAIVLLGNPYPFLAGFMPFANQELTSADGSFAFTVTRLARNTQFRVATVETHPSSSAVLTVRVAVRVTLHVRPTHRRGYGLLYGTVEPAQALALVQFQYLRPGHAPAGIGSTVLQGGSAGRSRFHRIVRLRRPGLYRAFVRVTSGAQVPNQSRPVLVR